MQNQGSLEKDNAITCEELKFNRKPKTYYTSQSKYLIGLAFEACGNDNSNHDNTCNKYEYMPFFSELGKQRRQ